MVEIRAAKPRDTDAIWAILEPVIRAGETYSLPREMDREQGLSYWFSSGHEAFVAEDEGEVVGTYYIRPNQLGGGSHVANCGYITAACAFGRGVARGMCSHSLEYAKARGYRSMQFNLVLSTNERAVRLWQSLGFEIVGRLQEAFLHPVAGYIDAYVMYRFL